MIAFLLLEICVHPFSFLVNSLLIRSMSTDFIISKVWGFCTTLRDDSVGYGDYLGLLTDHFILNRAGQNSCPAV